jgi:lysozyme
MEYSSACVALVKKYEGLSLTAYQDADGYSIGYGHFGASEGQTITEEEAEQLLISDLNKVAERVNSFVVRALTQGQFDSLCDFVFNLGAGVFHRSKLLYYVNQGMDTWAVDNLLLYVYAGGKIQQSLLNRRNEEVAMYKGIA